MNGCEFCGTQEAELWLKVRDQTRLFCTEDHMLKFKNVENAVKFHAGWSTIEMLIAKELSNHWLCKAYRGMAELEFSVLFDDSNNITKFTAIQSS